MATRMVHDSIRCRPKSALTATTMTLVGDTTTTGRSHARNARRLRAQSTCAGAARHVLPRQSLSTQATWVATIMGIKAPGLIGSACIHTPTIRRATTIQETSLRASSIASSTRQWTVATQGTRAEYLNFQILTSGMCPARSVRRKAASIRSCSQEEIFVRKDGPLSA